MRAKGTGDVGKLDKVCVMQAVKPSEAFQVLIWDPKRSQK